MFIFRNLPDPRGLGCARTPRYDWLYPRQSQASLGGYYGGNPRTSPKIANVFSKYFCLDPKLLVYLERTGVRHRQLRYGVGRVMGPPTPLGYGTPLTTPRLRCLWTRNPSEVYLCRIREYGNKVKKTKARTHKASMGHTVNSMKTNFLYL